MLHLVTFRTLALTACGLLLAGAVQALTLGQPRGSLLIGRPLDVTLPVTLDAADGQGACASGELFYGDTPVGRPPEVRWLPGPNGREGVLRITSAAPVDEPTVTLNVRVGCGTNAASRRYVLLPDVPRANEPTAPLPVPRPEVAPSTGAATAAVPGGPATGGSRATPPAAATGPASGRPRRDAGTSAAAPAPASTPAAAPAAAAPRPARGDSRRQAAAEAAPRVAESRLRLTPLELGPERDAILHFSTELTLPGAGDPGKRAAAAALWAALNKTPEDAAQDALKLQALDREIQSLRQTTQQNSSAVSAMREQVEQARGERSQASLLALLLLGLLLALAGWLGWRWYQSRRLAGVTRWFEANHKDGDDATAVPTAPASAPAAPRQPVPILGVGAALPRAAARPPIHPHLQTTPVDVAAVRAASAWAPAEVASDFQPSKGGTQRMVGVRELLDVHDKADFFLSIGQHEQAIAVLEAHVHDQVETSALPWLDLLELYHSMGRRREFEQRRAEFRQHFTAQVPDFDHFGDPTGSLENYSRALSRIVALWPSRRVLEVIEESIFRRPGLAGADSFSLEAYRELVLLYHIAQEVAPSEDAPAFDLADRGTGFSHTSMQSLSELDRPEIDLDVPLDLDDLAPAPHSQVPGAVPDGTLAWGDPHASERDPLFVPPPSARLGLDIDLTDATVIGEEWAGEQDAALPGEGTSGAKAPDLSEPLTLEPAGGPRLLPPLDFDTSAFDPDPDDAQRRR